MNRIVTGAFLLACLAACGEGKKDPAPSEPDASDFGPDAETPRAPNGIRCESDEHVGTLRLERSSEFIALSGSVVSDVVESASYTVVGMEAGCTLLKKKNPFCDPPCSGGMVCTVDSACAEQPLSVNLGTLRVDGLELSDAALENVLTTDPQPPGQNYSVVVEGDAPAGASIRLSSSGGDRAPLSLYATGLAPMVVTTENVTVEPNKPVKLAWEVPAKGAALVRLTLNIDQHGNSPITLTCDVEDDGAHEIPASLVDALLESGVSGFPTAFVQRDSVDSLADDKGCIEFNMRDRAQRPVTVVGHTPCKNNTQCKNGQVCDVPTETCVDP
jgi:hypothetical protein